MNSATNIADEIYRELQTPSDTSAGTIGFWLRDNVGNLNNLLSTNFTIVITDGSFTPDINDDEKSIFKKMYVIYYYDKFIRQNLGAAAYSSVLQVDSDGDTVRLVDKTNIAKVYIQLKKEETDLLQKLVNGYKSNKANPTAIFSDDLEEGPSHIVRDYSYRKALI